MSVIAALVFIGLLILTVPVAHALLIASGAAMAAEEPLFLFEAILKLYNPTSQFPMLAIPFFILADDLMMSGRFGEYLMNFTRMLVGWMKGGLSQVSVLGSLFFGGVSGSAVADASALGNALIPVQKGEGYPDGYSAAVNSASSTISVLIPPSIPLILYGLVTEASIPDLFLAGIVPGVMLTVVMFVLCYVIGRVLLVIMGSSVLQWILSYESVPQNLANWMLQVLESPWTIILAMNLLMIVIGTFLDLPAAVLLLAPIFLGVASAVGLEPVQLGVIMVVNLAIGLYTPPVGTTLFVSVAIEKVPMGRVVARLAPFYVAALIEAGVLPESELETNGADDSRLPMSGMAACTPGMEITGGSLGHGLGIAVGMALGLKRKRSGAFVYNLLSDGELGEGSTWEAAIAAAHHELDNLIAVVDFNNQQADGPSTRMLCAEPIEEKWTAFGWHTQRVGGNDINAVRDAFDVARRVSFGGPRVIICDTLMGKGVPFLEQREKTHFIRIEQHEWALAVDALDAGRPR